MYNIFTGGHLPTGLSGTVVNASGFAQFYLP